MEATNRMSQSDLSVLNKNGIVVIDNEKFICTSCNCPIYKLNNVKHHLEGYLHQQVLLQHELKKLTAKKPAENPSPSRKTKTVRENGVLQPKNNLQPNKEPVPKPQPNSGKKKEPQPISGKKKENVPAPSETNSSVSSSFKRKQIFNCSLCQIECNSKDQLQNHLTGMMHQSNVVARKILAEEKKLLAKNKTQKSQTNQVGSSKIQHSVVQPTEKIQQKKLQQTQVNTVTKVSSATKVQNWLQVQDKVVQQVPSPKEPPKQPKKVQTEVAKPEIKNQPKQPVQTPTEGLLYLYDILFLKPGALNIFHPIKVQKFMEEISVTFVRENKIYCMVCATNMPNSAKNLSEHIRSSEHEENIKSILENHEQFIEFPDQFSDLRLAKELMREVSDDEIDCFVCTAKLPNNDIEVGRHVETAKHKTTRAKMLKTVMEVGYSLVKSNVDNWYDVDNYSCQICEKNFVSEIKFFNHLSSNGHKEKIQAVMRHYYFDFCNVCSYLCFGEEKVVRNHSLSHRHEFNLRTEKYLVPEMPDRVRKALEDVKGFVGTIIKFVDGEKLNIAKLAMSNLATSNYRRGTIPLEELDLEQVPSCLEYTIVAKDRGNFEENFRLVDMLWKADKGGWQQLATISKIDPRSILMFNAEYAFQCRIIFDNVLLQATKYLRCYLEKFKSCRRTLMFLENWLTYCNLDSNEISFFALAWFVIFYYQNVHKYPSLQEVSHSNGSSKKITKTVPGWKKSSLAPDLKGFFIFYSTFDFKTQVLSPLLGRAIEKSKYFQSKPSDEWRFVLAAPVVLENPAEQGQAMNVTQNMTKLTLRSFRRYCAESAELLT